MKTDAREMIVLFFCAVKTVYASSLFIMKNCANNQPQQLFMISMGQKLDNCEWTDI